MTHQARPVFLCLPAMGVPAAYYAGFTACLAEAVGGTALAVDLRGQGVDPRRARDGDVFGYREIVEQDLPELVLRWRSALPDRPIYLLGHSLGGQLATLATAELAPHLAGLVLIAAGTACPRHWPAHARWRARAATWGIRLAAALLPWYPGRRLGFGGDQPARLMRDWSYNARTGRYRLEGSRRGSAALEQGLAEVRLPVLSLSLRHDPVAPPGATQALLALLPSARLRQEMFSGVVSDPAWRRHFSWARQPDEVAAKVAAWLHSPEVAAWDGRCAPLPEGLAQAA